MPSLSKLHTNCLKCPQMKDCDEKRMVACAYITPAMVEITAPAIQPNIQPVLRETITIHTGKNAIGDVTMYKDEIEEQLKKHLGFHMFNSAT